MKILGIDPGASTGCAMFDDGMLISLNTIEPWRIPEVIQLMADRVIFEDSRLQSNVWGVSKLNRAAAMKVARNIGQIDAWCALIVAACEMCKVPAHGISPLGKGAKLNAVQFSKATGWELRSNSHERDAAMVAWPYRRAT